MCRQQKSEREQSKERIKLRDSLADRAVLESTGPGPETRRSAGPGPVTRRSPGPGPETLQSPS